LPAERPFELSIQPLVVVVRSRHLEDVIAGKEPRPIALAHGEELLTDGGQPRAEVSPVGRRTQEVGWLEDHGITAGPRIITEETRATMRQLLEAVRDGSYARAWLEENERGRPWFNAQREAEQHHPIEEVGKRLRAMMPFLKPR